MTGVKQKVAPTLDGIYSSSTRIIAIESAVDQYAHYGYLTKTTLLVLID